MPELSYEQRMAIFDIIAGLKTGIVCECGNRTCIDDIGLSEQIKVLEKLYLDAIKPKSTNPTYTIDCTFDGTEMFEIVSLPKAVPIPSKIVHIEVESFDTSDSFYKRVSGKCSVEIYVNDVPGIGDTSPWQVLEMDGKGSVAVTKKVNRTVSAGEYIVFRVLAYARYEYRATLTMEAI